MLSTLLTTAALVASLSTAGGGTIRHYAPDDLYDKPILIRCASGPEKKVPEGQSSASKCADVDHVGVRRNEEIWCKQPAAAGFPAQWVKRFDSKGWHAIPDPWVDGLGCTVRRD